MVPSSDPTDADAAVEDPDDGDIRARVEALRQQSCWGACDPTIATVRRRAAVGFVRRGLWAEDWKRRHQGAPCCAVCGRLWTPRTGDLHEPAPTLARSAFQDLVPLCWAHHAALHNIIRATRAVPRLGYRIATREGVLRLRKRQGEHLPR